MTNRRTLHVALSFGLLSVPVGARAAQPLEAETARLMKAGRLKLESTFEYQTSPEGSETSLPMAFEWAIFDTLELSVEPVWYTAIRPKVGRSASGFGDTEATLAFRFFEERAWMPALAAAGEIKFPTALTTSLTLRSDRAQSAPEWAPRERWLMCKVDD